MTNSLQLCAVGKTPTPIGYIPISLFDRFQQVAGLVYRKKNNSWAFTMDRVEKIENVKGFSQKKFIDTCASFYNFCFALVESDFNFEKALSRAENVYSSNGKPRYIPAEVGFDSYKKLMDYCIENSHKNHKNTGFHIF